MGHNVYVRWSCRNMETMELPIWPLRLFIFLQLLSPWTHNFVPFLCFKVWNELDRILSFFVSNCLTGKGWVTPLRALLSAIFYGGWGLRFLASVGKLCLKSLYFMWNTTGVPQCGSSSPFLCKMIHLVTNLLFCFLVSLFKPDKRQRWVMFRCGVGKLRPPELLSWWELLKKNVMIKTTKVAPPSFTSIQPGV